MGHPAGDRCLVLVAETMNAQLRRPLDMASRLGGEEFVLLLPNTEAAGALVMAERVRGAIEALRVPHPGAAGRVVTISVGVATSYPHAGAASADAMLEEADRALYQAKQRGRNMAVAAQGGVIDLAAVRLSAAKQQAQTEAAFAVCVASTASVSESTSISLTS